MDLTIFWEKTWKRSLQKRSLFHLFEILINVSYLQAKKKYIYYKISRELKSIKKRPFQGKTSHKNLSNKNLFNFRKYLLDVKSIFLKIIRKKDARFIMTDSASKLV